MKTTLEKIVTTMAELIADQIQGGPHLAKAEQLRRLIAQFQSEEDRKRIGSLTLEDMGIEVKSESTKKKKLKDLTKSDAAEHKQAMQELEKEILGGH